MSRDSEERSINQDTAATELRKQLDEGRVLWPDQARRLLDENERLCEALSSILTTVEDANRPYERLTIGALARTGLGEA